MAGLVNFQATLAEPALIPSPPIILPALPVAMAGDVSCQGKRHLSPPLCCYGRTLLNLSATLAIASISLVTVSPSFFFFAFCCYGNNPFLLSLVTSSSLYPSLGHLLFQMVAMAISLSQLCLPNQFFLLPFVLGSPRPCASAHLAPDVTWQGQTPGPEASLFLTCTFLMGEDSSSHHS